MKHFALTTVLAATLSLPAISQEVDPIKDQIDLTRGAVQLMIESLRDVRNSQGGLDHLDYEEASEQFQKRLVDNLGKFEKATRDLIINPLSIMVQQYNLVSRSRQYSASEKEALLNNLRETISVFCKSKEDVYKRMVVELINTMGIDINFINVYDNKYHQQTGRHRHFFERAGIPHDLESPYRSEIDKFITAYNAKYSTDFSIYFGTHETYKHQAQLLTKGCLTSSCKSLLSVVFTKFTTMLKETLDRGLTFKLDANHTFSVKPSGGDYSVVLNLINWSMMMDLAGFPFALRPTEYELTEELLSLANAEDFEIEGCRRDAARLKEELLSGSVTRDHTAFIDVLKRKVTNTTATREQLTKEARFRESLEREKAKLQEVRERIAQLQRRPWPTVAREREIQSLKKNEKMIKENVLSFQYWLELDSNQQRQNALKSRRSCLEF